MPEILIVQGSMNLNVESVIGVSAMILQHGEVVTAAVAPSSDCSIH